jgi:hypothetical protein
LKRKDGQVEEGRQGHKKRKGGRKGEEKRKGRKEDRYSLFASHEDCLLGL